jgi:hypothetical protein
MQHDGIDSSVVVGRVLGFVPKIRVQVVLPSLATLFICPLEAALQCMQ